MAKTLHCNDVIPGCKYVASGATEEEVLRQAAEHARLEHNIRRITPEISAMVRAAVRDDKASAA
ncbi:MAG TPA: DUF1059 domain-containing protein [Candidatus Limnocylindrales bacterium]|nr:DUF1059 domain-containing protein [Candidatus Limnocylindrales bacterium]